MLTNLRSLSDNLNRVSHCLRIEIKDNLNIYFFLQSSKVFFKNKTMTTLSQQEQINFLEKLRGKEKDEQQLHFDTLLI